MTACGVDSSIKDMATTTTDQARWLEHMAVGDTVLIKGQFGRWSVATVERITATQIVTTNQMRFKRADGWQLGGPRFYRAQLERPTIEKVQYVRAQEAREELRLVDWRTVPDDVVRATWAAVQEARKRKVDSSAATG